MSERGALGHWLATNGGPPALFIAGIAVWTITSRLVGLMLVLIGAAWSIANVMARPLVSTRGRATDGQVTRIVEELTPAERKVIQERDVAEQLYAANASETLEPFRVWIGEPGSADALSSPEKRSVLESLEQRRVIERVGHEGDWVYYIWTELGYAVRRSLHAAAQEVER